MLYEQDHRSTAARSDDSQLDPRQLLADIAALVEAGLVLPVEDGDGELRMTPAEPQEADGAAS